VSGPSTETPATKIEERNETQNESTADSTPVTNGIFLPTTGPGAYEVFGYVASVTGGLPYGYQLDIGNAPTSFGCYPCSSGQRTELGSFAAGSNLNLDVWYNVLGIEDVDMFSNNSSQTTVTETAPDRWQILASDMTLDIYAVALPPLSTIGPPPLSGWGAQPQSQCADPVNCATGNFTETSTDLAIPGNGVPLGLSRTYNSLASDINGSFGFGWSSNYEMHLAVASSGDATLTTEGGAELPFASNGSGGFIPASNVFGDLVQNGTGTYTATKPGGSSYTFADSGTTDASGAEVYRLASESDRNGYETTLAYNGSGQLTAVTDPADRTLTFAYGTNGLVSSVTDSAGRSLSYGYNASGDLTSVVDPDSNTTSYTYDANHDLLTRTGPRPSATTSNTYNSDGQVLTQQDPAGRTTTFSWGIPDQNGVEVNTLTSPNGNVRSETYADGVLQSLTKASGTADAETWNYGYDQDLDLTSVADPNGHVWSASYDGAGNQTGTTDPDGHTTSATYNAFDEPTATTDGDGNTATYTYDASGNLQTVSRTLTSSGAVQTTTDHYADIALPGDLTSVTDPDGHTTTMTYDTAGDLASSTDPDGNETTYGYTCSGTASAGCFSDVGLLYSQTSPRGNATGNNPANFTTSYTYDAEGNERTQTDPLSHTMTYTYDADGDPTSSQKPDGNTAHYAYNLDDELTSYTPPGGTAQTTTYDGDGNVLTEADGKNNTTHYHHNDLDQQISSTTPSGRETDYTYDPTGMLGSMTDPDGRVTTDGYNNADELTAVDYSDGSTPDVTYGYDGAGNQTSMSDGLGSASYVYDSLGDLTAQTDDTGTTVAYDYNLDDDVTGITYPNGDAITNTYDDADNLSSVSDWSGNTTQFLYNSDDDPTQITYPTATADVDSQTYDDADDISDITLKEGANTLASLAYTHNSDELLASESETGLPKPSMSQSLSYSYDDASEPTTLDSQSGYAYNADQELTSSSQATYGYNAEGDRTSTTPTSGPTLGYTYDQANQLATVSSGGTTSETEHYDGSGLLAEQTAGASTKNLTWNLTSDLPLLLDDGTDSYIYGPDDLPVEQVNDSNGNVSFLHHDELGSTRLITNAAGDQAAATTYSPYGRTVSSTGSATTTLGFAGQYTDPSTGLIYMRARWYDPTSGQFLTPDPLYPVTSQRYSYSSDDPVNFVDPTGQFPDPASPDPEDPVIPGENLKGEVGAGDQGGNMQGAGAAPAHNFSGSTAKTIIETESGEDGPTEAPGSEEGSTEQEERTCLLEDPIEDGPGSDTVVLGHYPEYRQAGGRTFNVPTNVWDAMTPEERWAANQRFLDRAIARGSNFQLATPADEAREGSSYERELQYLQSRGYTVGSGGTTMVPPGG
jgi:RHS repeat-associated protein